MTNRSEPNTNNAAVIDEFRLNDEQVASRAVQQRLLPGTTGAKTGTRAPTQ
jgi:hypothetical protein